MKMPAAVGSGTAGCALLAGPTVAAEAASAAERPKLARQAL
jgi:hypothetical protein